MLKTLFSAVVLAGALAVTGAVSTAEANHKIGQEGGFCISSLAFGELGHAYACSTSDTGVNYLACINAGGFAPVLTCYTPYPAQLGKDYRYCNAGEDICPPAATRD